MSVHPLPTRFAPADRAAIEELRRQTEYFSDAFITKHLLDAVPSILLILNEHRQIVYANRTGLDLIGIEEERDVYGLRPGEVLSCVNAGREPGGCGTAEGCAACGMVAAILSSLSGRKEVRECRFLRRQEGRTEALDLLVWATPLQYREETFTVFALNDISHEKRRRALERIFFHDVLNVVGSIKGFAEILREYDPADRRNILGMIHAASEQAIEEIELQRTLAAAESKELKVRPEPLSALALLEKLLDVYSHHAVSRDRHLMIEEEVPETIMVSDRVLLGRILGNMIKNALEASGQGETVRVGYSLRAGERIAFHVHNSAVIPEGVRHEIFQRSFSTKGEGRGLGTYSMKILTEYLQGDIEFTSAEGEGTTFRVEFPLHLS